MSCRDTRGRSASVPPSPAASPNLDCVIRTTVPDETVPGRTDSLEAGAADNSRRLVRPRRKYPLRRSGQLARAQRPPEIERQAVEAPVAPPGEPRLAEAEKPPLAEPEDLRRPERPQLAVGSGQRERSEEVPLYG